MPCSVVIPCHNGADLTRRCIESLLAQADGPPAEIVLADNASRDDTRNLGRMHPSVRVVPLATNRGFAGGVNAGIQHSTGDLVLVLNNDTQAAANLLREMTRALEAATDIGAVAPVSNHVKGPARLPVGDHGQGVDGRRAIATALQDHAPLQDTDTLAGLCLLMRRTTLQRAGMFDERFGHGNFEDDDLCLRLRLHGHRLVIARRAFLHHEGHATFRALGLDLSTEIHRRRRQFVDKWRGDPAGRATIAAMEGDLESAAAAATAARSIWPLWPDADWHLARWHAANGDPARAAHHLRSLLRANPQHSDAVVALVRALVASGDLRGAEARMAAAAHSLHLDLQQQALLLQTFGEHDYRAGRTNAALAHFHAALELLPHDGATQNWIGLCELERSDFATAERAFRAAIAADYALAHTNLGICLHRTGRRQDARHSFERAVALLPHDQTAQNNLAALRGSSAPPLISSPDS